MTWNNTNDPIPSTDVPSPNPVAPRGAVLSVSPTRGRLLRTRGDDPQLVEVQSK